MAMYSDYDVLPAPDTVPDLSFLRKYDGMGTSAEIGEGRQIEHKGHLFKGSQAIPEVVDFVRESLSGHVAALEARTAYVRYFVEEFLEPEAAVEDYPTHLMAPVRWFHYGELEEGIIWYMWNSGLAPLDVVRAGFTELEVINRRLNSSEARTVDALVKARAEKDPRIIESIPSGNWVCLNNKTIHRRGRVTEKGVRHRIIVGYKVDKD